jgi:multiple sugar transport system ATP-binding protein
MNFVRGRISSDGAPALVTRSGFNFPIGAAPHSAMDRDIVLGVRPEHVKVGGSMSIAASILVVEPTGSETHLTANVDGQEFVCVFRERINGHAGEEIRLSVPDGPLHFFDAETGLAIPND